jgi:hypothetical protein
MRSPFCAPLVGGIADWRRGPVSTAIAAIYAFQVLRAPVAFCVSICTVVLVKKCFCTSYPADLHNHVVRYKYSVAIQSTCLGIFGMLNATAVLARTCNYPLNCFGIPFLR